ncbi:MAG: glycosyltransferase family 1 protein [Clostridia bacterium]|nr:glycosyltransferase family 1 protein [Clostridia bacterium]
MGNEIRILQIVPNMQQGGIENFIMNIYRNIDKNKIQFDFLVHYNKKCFFDEEIERLGGKIYRFPVMENKNVIRYIKELDKFFKEHTEYKVVHGHMASLAFIYLWIAKKNGVKYRIIHSHGTSFLKTVKGIAKYILFRFADKHANVRWACSNEAGKYLYKKKSFDVIPNAIDFKKFEYNPKIRETVRKELDINEETFVIGHVGRFNLQKNHKFIINLMEKLLRENENLKLLLIGDGETKEEINKLACDLNINNKIIFLGIREDVNRIYQAMDILIMPSLFEGLPVTGIEAQANGLKCLFSDNITREVDISKKSEFIKLSEEAWKNSIIENIHYKRDLKDFDNSIFNIEKLTKQLQRRYEEYYYEKFSSKKG